jgi:hypothetical protein
MMGVGASGSAADDSVAYTGLIFAAANLAARLNFWLLNFSKF